MDGWGYQNIPGKGVPPEDSSWKERIAVDLIVSWDNLIFTWMIYNTLYWWEHWSKVVVTINGNQLILDPIHQEMARQLSLFLKAKAREPQRRWLIIADMLSL